jgi:hypothetical protein
VVKEYSQSFGWLLLIKIFQKDMIVSDSDYETNVYVHKVDAEMRADCVSSASYNVTLCLPKGKNA